MRILSSEGGAEGNKMAKIGPSSTGAMGADIEDRKEVFVAVLLVAHRRRGAATVFLADKEYRHHRSLSVGRIYIVSA